MERNPDRQLALPASPSQPRPFIYRSVNQEDALPHSRRRSTDHPRAPHPLLAEPCTHGILLQFRVYLMLN